MTCLQPQFGKTCSLLLWLCVCCLTTYAHASNEAAKKSIVLRAIINIKNKGQLRLDSYTFHLTIPASDHAQQHLVRTEYPYADKYRLHTHENGVDRFMEFSWSIPPHGEITRVITFTLDVQAFDYRKKPLPPADPPHPRFLAPSQYVESNAPEIVAIARNIERTHASPEERLIAAYRYPIKTLRYRDMSSNEGALHSIRFGSGDCTEYAALFIALSRAMGIPARMTSEFHFSGNQQKKFSVPDHHSAEVYLGGSWLPIDPNLALDASLGYGFGTGSANKVILKRGDSWAWSYAIPSVPRGYRKALVETSISWDIQSGD